MKRRIKRRALQLIEEELGLAQAGEPGDVSDLLAEIAPLLRQIDVDQVVAMLSTVVGAWPDVEAAAIAWIDLIQVLVQNTEQRYRPGDRGEAKKAEVKAVLADLMRSSHVEVPDIPRTLQPVAIDVIADIAVDLIVAFLNRFPDPRWREAPAKRPSTSELWRGAWLAARRALGVVLEPLGALITRLYFLARPRTPLSPAVRSALRAVQQESLIAKERDLMQRVAALGAEVVSNPESAVALVELVGVVVRVVERFVDAPGPAKKAIAAEVVVTVLAELGFDATGPLASVKIDAGVGFLIDSTVHLFNARGQFGGSGGGPGVALAADATPRGGR